MTADANAAADPEKQLVYDDDDDADGKLNLFLRFCNFFCPRCSPVC